MILCELVSHKGSDPQIKKDLGHYLEKTLGRAVVYTNDTPAFAGNRIGFQLMNEIAQLAEKYANRYFCTPKKMGAETEEANINAGLASAQQIVNFLEKGDRTFQVNK